MQNPCTLNKKSIPLHKTMNTLVDCCPICQIKKGVMNKLKTTFVSFIVIVFLLGLSLLLISFLIPVNSEDTFLNVIVKLLSAIGLTLIGSGVVSVLFSFRDIREFSIGMTKEVLLDCKFINTFNNEQLETIHSSCHKALHYNNVELDENNWKVISDNCIKSFKEPYCKIWRENIDCRIVEKHIVKDFDIHYELHNPLKNIAGNADISRCFNLLVPEGQKKEDFVILSSMTIIVDGVNFDVKPFVVFYEKKLGNYNTTAIIKSDEIDLTKFKFKNDLIVKIKLTTKVPLSDLSYTNRLRYPTQYFRLDFSCENIKNNFKTSIYPQFFGGFIKKDGFDILIRDNHAFIDCKDNFLLPGSGASIVLNIEKNNSSKKKKK